MLTLAELLPVKALSVGRIISALDAGYPALMSWSRSGEPGCLPPRLLAHDISEALPAALNVTVVELIARTWLAYQKWGSEPFERPAVICLNAAPSIDILAPSGAVLWSIKLSADVTLKRSGENILIQHDQAILSAEKCLWQSTASLSLSAAAGLGKQQAAVTIVSWTTECSLPLIVRR